MKQLLYRLNFSNSTIYGGLNQRTFLRRELEVFIEPLHARLPSLSRLPLPVVQGPAHMTVDSITVTREPRGRLRPLFLCAFQRGKPKIVQLLKGETHRASSKRAVVVGCKRRLPAERLDG